jgi:hypothetical protein
MDIETFEEKGMAARENCQSLFCVESCKVSMKIYLKCPNTPSDWFIIELQGEVSVDGADETFNLDGLSFADISEREVCLD